jgi:translation initiation factor 3 subunit F
MKFLHFNPKSNISSSAETAAAASAVTASGEPASKSTTTSTITLPPSVAVSPLVCLSILDHFVRRSENTHRVIGALLGVRSEDSEDHTTTILVKNCFPLSFEESEDSVKTNCSHHLSFPFHSFIHALYHWI